MKLFVSEKYQNFEMCQENYFFYQDQVKGHFAFGLCTQNQA